jgi:hypothetical protein
MRRPPLAVPPGASENPRFSVPEKQNNVTPPSCVTRSRRCRSLFRRTNEFLRRWACMHTHTHNRGSVNLPSQQRCCCGCRQAGKPMFIICPFVSRRISPFLRSSDRSVLVWGATRGLSPSSSGRPAGCISGSGVVERCCRTAAELTQRLYSPSRTGAAVRFFDGNSCGDAANFHSHRVATLPFDK